MTGSEQIRRLLAASALAVAFVSSRAAEQPADEAPPRQDTAEIEIDGRVLFPVRGFRSMSAAARAANIRSKIVELARNAAFDPKTLEVAEGDHYTRIGPLTRPVVRITDDDAEIEGVDRALFSGIVAEKIQNAIAQYRTERTRENLLAGAWRALAATAVAAVVLFVLIAGLRSLRRWIERRFSERVKTLKISTFEVLRAERIWSVLRAVVKLGGVLAAIAVIVAYLTYTLGQFPWTRGIAKDVKSGVLSPLRVLGSGVVEKIPDLIFLAVLFLVVRYLLRMIRSFFDAAGRGELELPGFENEWAEPTYKIVRFAFIAFTLVVAYPYIPGSSSAAFQGISIFLGVLLSLGSSSLVSNIVAGYTMIYRRAFRDGDVVKIGDTFGFVSDVRLQATHVRTPKNENVVIPNASILNGEVINYSAMARDEGLILHTTVGIGYETPWRQVEAMLLMAADRTPGISKDPKPFVRQKQLGDFAIVYEINGYCKEPRQMMAIYSDLHRGILDVFNEYGVQIMTPAYEGDPEVPKVVPQDKLRLPPA